MGRMEIKIQFCPTIWESDSGERIGQGSFRCASSLAPVRVAARFRCASGRASGSCQGALQSEAATPKGIRVRVREWMRHASGARFSDLEGGRVSLNVVEQKMKWMQSKFYICFFIRTIHFM